MPILYTYIVFDIAILCNTCFVAYNYYISYSLSLIEGSLTMICLSLHPILHLLSGWHDIVLWSYLNKALQHIGTEFRALEHR